MYCPSCKDEFRPGFTRCAACDVDLVDNLDDIVADEPDAPVPGDPVMIRMRDYCGFLELDDARQARDRLASARIAADILIRQSEAEGGEPAEEYWLRVDADRYREVVPILGEDPGTTEHS